MARLTGVGFLAVGLIGFIVKVIFIPINQVGAEQRPCKGPACSLAPAGALDACCWRRPCPHSGPSCSSSDHHRHHRQQLRAQQHGCSSHTCSTGRQWWAGEGSATLTRQMPRLSAPNCSTMCS